MTHAGADEPPTRTLFSSPDELMVKLEMVNVVDHVVVVVAVKLMWKRLKSRQMAYRPW